jgi:tyramine---L-glutamate ligase
MKILVVEYITGGGFIDEALPTALLHEGQGMLTALLDDLLDIDNVTVCMTRDYRLAVDVMATNSPKLSVVRIEPQLKLQTILPQLIQQCDAVWPIAPETANALTEICQLVEAAGKKLLSSTAAAVAMAGDKLKTYDCLEQHKIPVIPTRLFSATHNYSWQWPVLKKIDGVGCEEVYLLENEADWQRLAILIDTQQQYYILQPYIEGRAMSLSCLFKQGKAWLISCNEQDIEIIDGKFVLRACIVNALPDQGGRYQMLIERVAKAIPQLWGYVGIDLIETEQGPLIVEINPRLTTSYVGLRKALGINIAEQVLRLEHAEPIFIPVNNLPITIKVMEDFE